MIPILSSRFAGYSAVTAERRKTKSIPLVTQERGNLAASLPQNAHAFTSFQAGIARKLSSIIQSAPMTTTLERLQTIIQGFQDYDQNLANSKTLISETAAKDVEKVAKMLHKLLLTK